MTGSPEDTIRAAAEAYLSGDGESFAAYLHDEARVLGSEQRDVWGTREEAMNALGRELERRQSFKNGVSGSLIEHIRECVGIREMGDTALFSTTGDLDIDGYYHRKASWTVVLRRSEEKTGGDWKIVHSHFSIHR
jgi:ketosteroid isomerase-like protein